ncbi:superfamily I DNA and RNA helicase and helicaseubunit, partial [Sulfolobaceae archaeon RB850M]
SSAYFLHVWGFHESKLSTNDVIPYLEGVKKLLENAEKVIGS